MPYPLGLLLDERHLKDKCVQPLVFWYLHVQPGHQAAHHVVCPGMNHETTRRQRLLVVLCALQVDNDQLPSCAKLVGLQIGVGPTNATW